MKLILAPMQGLADPIMRDALTRVGGIDECVTEFVRVTDTLLPERVFYRFHPELKQGGRTRSGCLVSLQLLGSDAHLLAENAARAAGLGAPGIDLNFGCPAPTVNRHRGGAVLLDEPEVIYDIIKAVRAAVPWNVPVTAKMRLGFKDKSRALECALAMQSAGASQITVHARTKVEGYKPPAHWDWIARIRETVKLPVVANGEVWTVADWHSIRAASGCDAVMIGRGLVASPGLALAIKSDSTTAPINLLAWSQIVPVLQDFFILCRLADQQYAVGRLKQWLAQLKRTYPEAEELFARIKEERQAEIVGNIVDGKGN